MSSNSPTREVSKLATSRYLSEAEAIARATERWQRSYASLSEVDKVVLDKAALGKKLKVVCSAQNVSYDTLQKRFKRWQEDLCLPSLNVLLYVWQVVRTQRAERATEVADDVPTLMRLAPEVALAAALQQRLGDREVSLPDSLSVRAPGLGALRSDLLRQQDVANLPPYAFMHE